MADVISFARGAPSPDLLPVDAVREAASAALAKDATRALSYGTGIGHPELCAWIGERHGGVDPSRVMVTNGSLEAGWFVFNAFAGPGDEVVVEQPSYDRTLLMLDKIGADEIGVPLESDGIEVGGIEQALADGHRPTLVHVIPNFHNPAGCTLSEAKRRRLVELSAEHGFVIFEDDPYREIRFGDAEALPTMLSLAEGTDARVIHASSFSKTVSPGVRVGYLVGPEDEIKALAKGAGETYISPNMLAESIVFELCISGALDENIVKVNAALAERRDAVVRELESQIPEAKFVVPGGGYFLWLDLDEGADAVALAAAAKDEGVAFVAGPDFMLEGGTNSLRLSFASVPPEDVPEGISRIAAALEKQRA
ncbi:MAG: PLP-dependent aminotransferase family protein [Solirubrobacterales bacterium]|nr:PLP-dependent aminotransferase family protein [Solirubrobacterales bacterium]MCO5326850.1 PLP-dependent aminotransferase family protein [Solirubrobacterales bacterium]